MFYRVNVALLTAAIILIALLASFKSWLDTSLDTPMVVAVPEQIVQVAPGSSLSFLARQLVAEGFVDSPYPLLVHSRLAGLNQIMTGEYRISPGETPRNFARRLVVGDVVQFRVTFPEGRSLRNWVSIINNHERLGKQAPVTMAQVVEMFPPPVGENLEGWFFPDTYTFTSTDSGLEILSRAHKKMQEILEEEWRGRAEGLPLGSAYEALILASIIEKETGVPEERSAIAGVFVRRLQQGMKLQTDPTVIYGLGRQYKGNLTRAHLKDANPYNTYHINGLPPTPITNPGREAIHAALHPLPGNELYFVAKGDGSHQFSATLAEHEQAVKRYQLQRAKDYRSSPQQTPKTAPKQEGGHGEG